MELATYTQLKADLNTLGENLDLLKELESRNAEAKVLSGKKLQIIYLIKTYKELLQLSNKKTQNQFFFNVQRNRIDISRKKIYKWKIRTGKDAQYF